MKVSVSLMREVMGTMKRPSQMNMRRKIGLAHQPASPTALTHNAVLPA